MQQLYGQCRGGLVLLHGGAGSWDAAGPEALAQATAALAGIATQGMAELSRGISGLDVVAHCLYALEADAQFNAGVGATLQADGVPRLTSALMDGRSQRFSGVISSTYLEHPSLLASHLQGCSTRVLTAPGTELLARQLQLPVASALTAERAARWAARVKAGDLGCDTVGCLVRSASGELYAGTSTGGRGGEFPGRVSDSATVAGTYCSADAGVSATGIGEEIVDDALAARLETRRRDGQSLEGASRRCFAEASARGRSYGWIAHDRDGHWAVVHTTPAMAFLVIGEAEGIVATSART